MTDDADAAERIEPFSAEWRLLCETDPSRVWRGLTPQERQDPAINPRHPYWLGVRPSEGTLPHRGSAWPFKAGQSHADRARLERRAERRRR